MDFKKIDWALVIVLSIVFMAVVGMVTFLTHTEVVVVTNDKGETVTNNVTKLGTGAAPKNEKAK